MSNIAEVLAKRQNREHGVGTNKKPIPFNKQDYQNLKRECLEKKTLFCDPTFPVGSDSLGYNELGPNSSKVQGVEWKRPKELCANPQFIVDGAKRTDICQGAVGDCWLMATIASLTLNNNILERVVPPDQSFSDGYAGIFHFQLWQYGEWVDVVIDDRLPTKNGKLLFLSSAEHSEFWSALLEKACAKVNGSYEALDGGLCSEGFEDFTGGIAEIYKLSEAPPDLFKIIQKAFGLGSLLSCAIDKEKKLKKSLNLKKEHAYSVTGAEEVQCLGRTVQLVRLRNPWGHKEWTGAWSDNSSEWNNVRPEQKVKLNYSAEDGEFWMAYSDFVLHFSVLEICNLTPDTLTSDKVRRWNYCQFDGTWKVGSTAGGGIDNPCSHFLPPVMFCSNPQFAIKLEDVDDDPHDGENGCTVLVGLMQKDGRKDKRIGRELKSIGFYIFEVPDEYKGRSNVHLSSDVLLENTPVERSKGCQNLREISKRCNLPPGEYVIVPYTYEPLLQGSFILRVFTEKKATASPMDVEITANIQKDRISDSDVDPSCKELFMQFVGSDSEVSAKELQQMLNKFVSERTDITSDGFSRETCRHSIDLLDKNGSGKLGLVEFHTLWIKIQKYLEIFKKRDTDKSGTMSSYEMRDTLKDAGFQVNGEVLQVIISRYANKQQAIDFDNFVGCLINLEMRYTMFEMFDNNTGKIELDIHQWLCLTLN
ncbi:calpain-2 catalytic subunit-like [Misgurnus anguillicaudatus]|uniref:calpain-2 catalytic subunit-like n=1 Tax=Misgurnus anguillicaudatus TaxID=75329 RepID=UPI003CCFA1A7